MRSAKEVKGSERKDKGNHEPNPRKNPMGEGGLIHTDTGHVSNGTIKNGKKMVLRFYKGGISYFLQR